jgi:hypothetical protein
MTDALEMAGITECWVSDEGGERIGARPIGEIVARALEAGNDLLVFSRPIGEVVEQLTDARVPADPEWKESGGVGSASLRRIERLRAAIGPLGGGAPRDGREGEDLSADAAPYRVVARGAVHLAGEFAGSAGTKGYDLSFAGEEKDFANGAVVRFVSELAGRLGTAACADDRGGCPPFPGAVLRRAVRCGAPGTNEPMEISIHGYGERPSPTCAIRVLLNRRPLPPDICAELCADTDLVIVAGWPYAARFLPSDTGSIITYGVYDAAVDVVASLITGRAGKTD